jgi:hypothetical protein
VAGEARGGKAIVIVWWVRRYNSTGGVRDSASKGSHDRSNAHALSRFYFFIIYIIKRVLPTTCVTM